MNETKSVSTQEYCAAEAMQRVAGQAGLLGMLGEFFGPGVKIRLPFHGVTLDEDISVLQLSVRSQNCLMRARLTTLERVIEAISETDLTGIRALGASSRAEIKSKLCEYGYGKLTEREQRSFLMDVLSRSCAANAEE